MSLAVWIIFGILFTFCAFIATIVSIVKKVDEIDKQQQKIIKHLKLKN